MTPLLGHDPPVFAGFVRDLGDRAAPHRQNQRLQQRMAFLAQAGLVLDRSLDHEETLRRLTELTVPELAQLTVVDLLDDDGYVRTAVAAAADGDRAREVERMRREHPLARSSAHPVAGVLRTVEPVLPPVMTPEFQRTIAERMRALRVDATPALPLGNRRARTLQQGLLPRRLPVIPGAEVAARFLAAADGQEVGGDFYDAFPAVEDRSGIAVGDVCGNGPEAAALTALARYTIHLIIVRSTINLAHDLGLAIIAEGVEDEPTLERLTELGCDRVQGFHVGRPMPPDAFNEWMHPEGAADARREAA